MGIIKRIYIKHEGVSTELNPMTDASAVTSGDSTVAYVLTTLSENKVDKVSGKGLSTNDFTSAYKTALDNLSADLYTKVDKVTGKGLSTKDFTAEYKTALDLLDTNLGSKVDKVTGKGLSTYDFSSTYKTKLDNLDTNLGKKVDKIAGKGLSTNDFTSAYKTALDNLNSNLNTKVDKVTGKGLSTNDYTTTEKTKLAGLSNYSLPTASTSTLGGVKIDGASITIANGVISVNGDTLDLLQEVDADRDVLIGGVQEALGYGTMLRQEIDANRFTRSQEYKVTLINKGVKEGLVLSKATEGTARTLNCTLGTVFMNGREYDVEAQTNVAPLPEGGEEDGEAIVYAYMTDSYTIGIASTELNGSLPNGAIELARASIPASNTSETLDGVTLTDTARREPNWPVIVDSPAQAAIVLNRTLPNNDYKVTVNVLSFVGGRDQTSDVYVLNKYNNGFTLETNGSADDIVCGVLVQLPSL